MHKSWSAIQCSCPQCRCRRAEGAEVPRNARSRMRGKPVPFFAFISMFLGLPLSLPLKVAVAGSRAHLKMPTDDQGCFHHLSILFCLSLRLLLLISTILYALFRLSLLSMIRPSTFPPRCYSQTSLLIIPGFIRAGSLPGSCKLGPRTSSKRPFPLQSRGSFANSAFSPVLRGPNQDLFRVAGCALATKFCTPISRCFKDMTGLSVTEAEHKVF